MVVKLNLFEMLEVEGDEPFLEQSYQACLQRSPDPAGRQFYLQRLLKGHARTRILGNLVDSPEGEMRGASVPGLAWALRLESRAGWPGFAGRRRPTALNAPVEISAALVAWLARPTNEFLRQAHQALVGLPPAEAALRRWRSECLTAEGRLRVLTTLLERKSGAGADVAALPTGLRALLGFYQQGDNALYAARRRQALLGCLFENIAFTMDREVSEADQRLLEGVRRRQEFVRRAATLSSQIALSDAPAAPTTRSAVSVESELVAASLSPSLWTSSPTFSVIESGEPHGIAVPILEGDRLVDSVQRARSSVSPISVERPRQIGDWPLISIVVPIYNTPVRLLREMIDSVVGQSYPLWELCLVDDASTSMETQQELAVQAARDARIKVTKHERNGNISAATNTGIAMAKGSYCALLDHDDLISQDALLTMVRRIELTAADVLYSDQDTVDDDGHQMHVFRKPAWSPEYLRHVMYIGHLLVVRTALLRTVGGCDSRFDGVQDFELMLRLSEATEKIVHVPEILYHWRATAGSLASNESAKADIDGLQARAVQAHLDRRRLWGVASPHPTLRHRCVITPKLQRTPKVSIIIPSRDQPAYIGPCLDSIFKKSSYPDFDVIVVDNGTTDPAAKRILATYPVKVVAFDEPFNYSRANNLGAAASDAEIFIFLNNDTAVIAPGWIDEMVHQLQDEGVGAVGALLLYADNRVQHAGVVLGCRGTADHLMRFFPGDSDGYAGSLSCPREVTVVSAACLAVRKGDFDRVGGFSTLFANHYQDVDFCLKIGSIGLRNVFTPRAALYHYESVSRGKDYDLLDRALLLDTWCQAIKSGDPYYPAAFSVERLDYSPAES